MGCLIRYPIVDIWCDISGKLVQPLHTRCTVAVRIQNPTKRYEAGYRHFWYNPLACSACNDPV